MKRNIFLYSMLLVIINVTTTGFFTSKFVIPLIYLKGTDEIIWIYTLVGCLFGLLLTSALAWYFSGYITRPINQLNSISKEISSGNYSKRVGIYSNDELGQLANAFNEMSRKLEGTISELVDKNVRVDSIINSISNGIIAVDALGRIILINSIACEMFKVKPGPGLTGMKITEIIKETAVNGYLREAIDCNASSVNDITHENRTLRVNATPIKSKDSTLANSGGVLVIQDITDIRKLENIRSEFVSNVTHELKTPLTSIRGFIETLRNGAINDESVAERFLEIIDIEAERLSMLINDILQLSEIETRQRDINISTVNLRSIAQDTLSILQNSAVKKNISILMDIDDVNIAANSDRIKQMLINLIDNAIKYNKENGSVKITAGKSEGKTIVTVSDTGIGIPSEHIPRIFERFYRVDKGRSRSMGGTGLGLSIVKHIVNLYNGEINVTSEPAKGTEFVITFS